MYILNKITLTTENRSTVLRNLFLLDMSILNELAIKNYPAKKPQHSLFLWSGIQPPHDRVLVQEDETFRSKVLRRLYRISKFNILANSNLVLSTS